MGMHKRRATKIRADFEKRIGKQTKPFVFILRTILFCRFVNDVLQIWERKKNLFRGTPIKRPHREVIVLALANSELLLEIMKGKELV